MNIVLTVEHIFKPYTEKKFCALLWIKSETCSTEEKFNCKNHTYISRTVIPTNEGTSLNTFK